MDTSENPGFRQSAMSQLRPPTRYPDPSVPLHPISDSQSNSRAQITGMAPPQKGLKRQYTGNNQPEPKRKTLADMGGECYGSKLLPPSATLAARQLPTGNSRVTLTNKPTSSHVPNTSISARQATAGGYAASLGHGARPQSRPPSASTFHQSVNGRQRANTTRARPATAMGHRAVEDDPETGNQKNSWDMDERLNNVESQFRVMKEAMDVSLTDRKTLEDAVDVAKTRVSDLERERDRLDEKNLQLRGEIDGLRQQAQSLTLDLEGERRKHQYDLDDKAREHRNEVDQLRRELSDETERQQKVHREALEALERHYRVELEDERIQKAKEIQELKTKLGTEQQDLNLALDEKDRGIQSLRVQMEELKSDLQLEQTLKGALQKQIAEMSITSMTLEDRNRALRAQLEFLESDSKQQSDSFANMEARLQEALRHAEEARQKLMKEETERRILFNKYQELKGNIRVMCRVRPVLETSEGDEAKIMFPDLKTSAQIDIMGPEEKSSLGNVSRKTNPFEFDRVFSPDVHNEEVFGEISQLVQSALDGYNVCIFCYGQTGSGKTYTMSSQDGMIPRATHMIYDTVTKLKEKSWTYTMEGSFVEVYNEELRDLLTPAKEVDPKKKIEIRHDEARKQTSVSNCKSVYLDSADRVEVMLRHAQNNRSVAATKANERSSRSHSVFILKLVGENSATGERCEGTLNLVDLAGSERLNHSGAEGDRMKETQNINKSLSCLGDVIEALGRGSAHIPYRNSKLTHLLQYSLGGNSKTLMFVMVSPLEAHLKETLTSLRFATKVHNTHIGTAKSTKKTKERSSDL